MFARMERPPRTSGITWSAVSALAPTCRRQVGAKALTADHVIPLVRGGRSIRANMVPCCKDCNTRKQSLLAWQWDAYVEGFSED